MFILPVEPLISLGLLEKHHAPLLFAVVDANRKHLCPWFPWVDDTRTVKDSEIFIVKGLQWLADGTDISVGIFYEYQLVGHMSLNKIKPNHCAEIGYWISAEHEGKGITTKSAKALVDYAFRELSLERIEIVCRVGNDRSIAIPKKLGFTLEGIVEHGELYNGTYYDLEQYSLLKDDYIE